MKKYLVLLAFACLTACGHDDGGPGIPGSDLPALTATQKTRLSAVSQEVTDVTSSTAQRQQTAAQAVGNAFAAQNQPVLSQKGLEYKQEIDNSINTGLCQVVQNGGVPAEWDIADFNFEFSIVDAPGSVCPFASKTNFKMKVVGKQVSATVVNGSMEMSLGSSFNAKVGTALYDNMDIYSLDQSFRAQISFSGSQNSVTLNMNGDGHVTLLSKTEDKVINKLNLTMNLTGSQSRVSASMQIVFDYVFNDFRAVGVARIAVTNENTTTAYYINGKATTEEEFNKYFSPALTDDILGKTPLK